MSKLIYIIILTAYAVLFSNAYAQSPEEINRRAAELADKKKYTESFDLLKISAEKQDAEAARVFHNKGWLMEIQGNTPSAMNYYREAVKRNPNLADSYERMGYINYKAGKYSEAVAFGEKVLQIDPPNKEVRKWIYDAYRKKTARPGVEPEKTAEQTLAEKEASDSKKKEEKKVKLQATFDFALRTGYYYKNSKYKYIKSEGAISNFPYNFNVWFKPIIGSNTRFSFTAGTPHLGAGLPQIISQFEKPEVIFSIGNFGIGAGLLISHYNSNSNFNEDRSFRDVKAGAILEYSSEDSVVSINIYPRYVPLFYDDKRSKGQSLDACTFDINYRAVIDDVFGFVSRLRGDDYYLFNHEMRYSNYYGFYDATIGLSLAGKPNSAVNDVNVSLEFGKRVYLRRINVQNPYTWLNGTGYFGIDRKRTNKKIFSGYYGTSNLLILNAEQSLSDFVFIYQKLLLEFVDRNNTHSEYTLTLGVGGRL